MRDAPDTVKQDLTILLAYRRQLTELHLAEQRRLSHILTEGEQHPSETHLAQLSRLLSEADAELMQSLQTPLRPNERRGWCWKIFRE